MKIETTIEKIDGRKASGSLSVEIDRDNGAKPDQTGSKHTTIESVEQAILSSKEYPESAVDVRDVVPVISNGTLYSARLRDIPGIGLTKPAAGSVKVGRGAVDVRDFGAVGDGRRDDSAAFHGAIDAIDPGGVVHVPPGMYRVRLSLPATKSFVLRGASRLASHLVGMAGKDIVNVDRGDRVVQRRVGRSNRHIYEDLSFWLDGTDADYRGRYRRQTASGWRAAHACIAYEAGEVGSGKHDAWCNSYGVVQRCLFSQMQKGHHGGTAIYFGSTHYGWTFEDIEIGEHGSDIAGTSGGIIDGLPPWGASKTELSSDSCYYHRIRHWNPSLSLSLLNQANSSIGNVEVYHQTWRALEVLGVESHNRKMPRDLSIFGAFYNDNELDDPSDAPDGAHIVIDCESTAAASSVIHIKGARKSVAKRAPVVILGGYGFTGRFKFQSSQSAHHSPRIIATGSMHRVEIDAAGYTSSALRSVVDDRGNGSQWDVKKVT